MDEDTRAYLDELRRNLATVIHQLGGELVDELQVVWGELYQVRHELRDDVRLTAVETRRHVDVVVDTVRNEIRALAAEFRARP